MATDIGTRIKRARERKRWSQQRLADALQVDRKTIDNWENGRTRPRSSVGALEDVLGTSLSEPEPEPDIAPAVARAIVENYTPEEAERMLEALRNRGESPPPTERGGAASGGRSSGFPGQRAG